MRATRFRDPTTILTVLALLALPTLAWLQARWLDDVSTMTRERVDRAAANAAAGVARDLEFELGRAMPWNTPPATGDAAASAGIPRTTCSSSMRMRRGRCASGSGCPGSQGCADRAWPAGIDDLRAVAQRHFGAQPRPRAVTLAGALDRVTSTHIVYGVPLAGGTASPPTVVPPCEAARDALLLVRVDLEPSARRCCRC